MLQDVPFIEAYFKGLKQKPTAILLRTSHTPSTEGSAMGIANYWHWSSRVCDSTNYVVDEASTYRCVPDNYAAMHNRLDDIQGVISINLCVPPLSEISYWDDTMHARVLDRAAELVAALCVEHKIQPRVLTWERRSKWAKWKTRRRGGVIFALDGAFPGPEFLRNVHWKIEDSRATSKVS
jgi:hypothetical protein